MKIVSFSSGLGNQIFIYLFYKYLRGKYPYEQIFGYYNKKKLNKHNGLEVEKVFDILLPPRSFLTDVIAFFCRKLNGIGIKRFRTTDNPYNENAIYFEGYWQYKKFLRKEPDFIKYRNFDLDDENTSILNCIKGSDSVSIHVRRGDYLEPQFASRYGNIATLDYYNQAIQIVRGKVYNPRFFVFSDDIEWVKDNLKLDNTVYVTHNKGKNSYLDMFLMSNCKHNIIANSSFSFWAAMLNKNDGKIVVYPSKWTNMRTPDYFPESWEGL